MNSWAVIKWWFIRIYNPAALLHLPSEQSEIIFFMSFTRSSITISFLVLSSALSFSALYPTQSISRLSRAKFERFYDKNARWARREQWRLRYYARVPRLGLLWASELSAPSLPIKRFTSEVSQPDLSLALSFRLHVHALHVHAFVSAHGPVHVLVVCKLCHETNWFCLHERVLSKRMSRMLPRLIHVWMI